jgi:hypothetical protein
LQALLFWPTTLLRCSAAASVNHVQMLVLHGVVCWQLPQQLA